MKEKGLQKFKTSEVIILVSITFIVSLVIGMILGKKTTYITNKETDDKNLLSFVENYNYILKNYYKKVDKEELIDGAIKGMMESLDDPYSNYFDKNNSNSFNILLNGDYNGLGIEYYQEEETKNIVVASILKNSPASKVDLKVKDIILSIDEVDLTNCNLNELSSYVANSKNVSFKLKIKRNNKIIDVEIAKSKVNIESVTSDIYNVSNKKIGYIYLSIFAANTYSQFKEHLEKLEAQSIDSLIIDVRQNTGGHLSIVEDVLSDLLSKKQVAYMIESNNKVSKVYGKSLSNKNYKIVLLGDKISASASEVLISSLRDNLNSIFIGEKTYGKGSVQELITLSDNTQYKLTTKRWLTPKQKCVTDTKGITPDIEVKLSEKYFETYNPNDDNQLQEAIKYIKENYFE